ncbi:hypothetical protein FMO003_21770 [Moritella sp. F3]|nr:hypothetical protein FMO001_35960 [Moritella sp. F1]GIC81896.1 hypothetical protein FMO003_21770 [Moritella sp. F3]
MAVANEQDVYISAGVSTHELQSIEGNKISVLFGARNYYQHNWFLGGELEGSYIDYDTKAIHESYSLGANIPIGKRFYFSDDSSIDIYGLIGYSMTDLNLKPKNSTIHGLKWGLGTDVSFSDFMVGVRWTQAELGNDDNQDKLREKNITLLAGYKF